MKPWTWFTVIAGLAAAFVAVSSITLAIRQDSWGPIVSVGWLPAVIVATWPATYRRCLPRRNQQPR
jgi:hypothetical protein